MNNEHKFLRQAFPIRSKSTHKGDYGKGLIIGGSEGMAGSVYLSSYAAMRTGLGLSYLAVPASIAPILQIKVVEQIVLPLSAPDFTYTAELAEEIKENYQDMDALAIGSGMGQPEGVENLLEAILTDFDGPIVIDADGLNNLAKRPDILRANSQVILSPHEMEFSRLSRIAIKTVKENRHELAVDFAKEYRVVLVLKGNETIVTDGDDVYINKTGNPGMATAGSGDVLTGIILALSARGTRSLVAAKAAVYMHGLAGDIAAGELGEDSLMARDIIDNISPAILEIQAEN